MSLGVINIADLCNLTHFRSPSATATPPAPFFSSASASSERIARPFAPRLLYLWAPPCLLFLRFPANHHARNDETADETSYAPRHIIRVISRDSQWLSRKKQSHRPSSSLSNLRKGAAEEFKISHTEHNF